MKKLSKKQAKELIEGLRARARDNDTVNIEFMYKGEDGEIGSHLLEPGDFYLEKLTRAGRRKLTAYIADVLNEISGEDIEEDAIMFTKVTINHANKFN